jgi:hypothetical protein
MMQTRVDDLASQQELIDMGKLLEKTYDEEWAEKVHILAAEEAKVLAAQQVLGHVLGYSRKTLRGLLEARFGALSSDIVHRIENCADLSRLDTAIQQVLHLSSPNELTL